MLGWLGGRVARRIRELALRCDVADVAAQLDGVELRLRRDQSTQTREYKRDLMA